MDVMERLTKRLDPVLPNCIRVKDDDYSRAVRKLADYEDAEEQGLLVWLQNKEGD